ncbi:hypothetical protein BB558_003224 [Smittium angustum]|uniref:Histidine kinase/HSP90-like ATPase domain-containing protein n=1 Tax=Smittium angustum TaxID=133377 RepID=A0A2U1J6X4_SMIAN|nr:hypothetical protein BB558_003224 [Smittium angustum]
MFVSRIRQTILRKPLITKLHPNAVIPALHSCLKPKLLKSFTTSAYSYSNDSNSESLAKEQRHEFRAETKKLLQIVAHSLYSQREVFIRELISNASDAMEKLRYLTLTNQDIVSEGPTQIDITIDKDNKTISFQDHGIGMTEKELTENLGTIARSGSKNYIETLENEGKTSEASKNIVGQFGVGFYSGFMVGDSIEVYSKSAEKDSKGYVWKSEGLGFYTLSESENVTTGTKIVINVKDDAKEFLDEKKVKVNGEKVNTIEAMWLKDKNSISEQDHESFYKFISHDYDSPKYSLVYRTDAPISIRSVLYIPKHNSESMGFERIKPGVSLYSRKVLIMQNAERVLPEWLRFIRGVVDSEDLPLNLSRELLQQGTLMTKLRSVLTNRIIKWLRDEAKKDPEGYKSFFKAFGLCLKEGVFTDRENSEDIASLLRFESSKSEDMEITSFNEYISRMGENENEIFYLCTTSKKIGIESPYYEPFKLANKEVIFLTQTQDEHVMNGLRNYKGKELVSIDSEKARDLLSGFEAKEENKEKTENDEGKSESQSETIKLTKEQGEELSQWFIAELKTKVKEVKVSSHLSSFPAVVTNFDSPAVRKMMLMMAESTNTPLPLSPCTLEINIKDPIIIGLYEMKSKNPELATKVAEQLFDNALVSAGIMDDPRVMVRRLNSILSQVVKQAN